MRPETAELLQQYRDIIEAGLAEGATERTKLAGRIHNVGRATKLFQGLASSPQVSLTPVEQKIEQEDVSNAAQRGVRWAVRPLVDGFEYVELNPITLDNVGPRGERMRRYCVHLGATAVRHTRQAESRALLLMPGLRSTRSPAGAT